MEFIDQKYVNSLDTDTNQSNVGNVPNSMNLVGETTPDNVKRMAESTPDTRRRVGDGYLVCDKCNRYYKLQPGESPEDFEDTCECGGKLEYRDKI